MIADVTPQISDKRRTFSPAFKMNIAKLSLAGSQSVSSLARQYDINTNQVFRWTREFKRQQAYWVKQALQLPFATSVSQLVPVKIQGSSLPAPAVDVIAEAPLPVTVATTSSLTLQFCSGEQLSISQLTPALLRMVLESLR
ncbi:MAG: transposase [Shewanella fodinae]|nr:transposase [Shewanella fodinae]